MGTDAGLFVHLALGDTPQIDLLQALLSAGWKLESRPFFMAGDDGDWEYRDNAIQVLEEIRNLEGTPFAVTLVWQDHGGGECLFRANGDLIFSSSIHRKTLSDNTTSDVSWYLERLLPPLRGLSGVHVRSWEWRETR